MNCPIQRSIVVSCITSHLPRHPELEGTRFNVICQPFWTDSGRTCNTWVPSFLGSAVAQIPAGSWLPARWLQNRTSLLGTSYSHKTHKTHGHIPDGAWGALSVPKAALIRAEPAFPGWRKAQLGSQNCSHLQSRAGLCLLPFVLPGKELCTHISAACWKSGSKLHSFSTGQNIPACACFNNCSNWEEQQRSLPWPRCVWMSKDGLFTNCCRGILVKRGNWLETVGTW